MADKTCILRPKAAFTPLEIKSSNQASSVRDQRSYPVSKRFLTGFTLVELLVVIAIIALLMSILMPALTHTRNQAKAVLCLSNLKQWGIVFSMYTDDNDGSFMTGMDGACWDGGWGYWWMTPLEPYYRDKAIRLCPMATKPYNKGGKSPFGAWYAGCDEVGGWEVDTGSYGPNGWICNPPLGIDDLWGRPTKFNWRTCTVRQAAIIPLFLDVLMYDAWPLAVDDPPPFEFWLADEVGMHEMRRFCLNRHNGYVNGVFLDFSTVRRIGLKELWRLKWHTEYDLDAPLPKWPEWMRNFKNY